MIRVVLIEQIRGNENILLISRKQKGGKNRLNNQLERLRITLTSMLKI